MAKKQYQRYDAKKVFKILSKHFGSGVQVNVNSILNLAVASKNFDGEKATKSGW